MTEVPDTSTAAPKKRGGGLSAMLLADLKSMAGGLGISGAGSMKKAQLVDAIKTAQASSGGAATAKSQPPAKAERPAKAPEPSDTRQSDSGQSDARQSESGPDKADRRRPEKSQADQGRSDQGQPDRGKSDPGKADQGKTDKGQNKAEPSRDRQQSQQSQQGQQKKQQNQDHNQGKNQGQGQDKGQAQPQGLAQDTDEDGEGGTRRNRRRRGRERQVTRTSGRNEPDTTILEDDVLVPAAGIIDVLDNYAFVRTSGYLPGTDDVYLSLSMVRKYGLRRGDAVVGQVRQPREGERREKFNPMVRVDSVNGAEPESGKDRPEFAALTPVHPHQRLRLAGGSDGVTGQLIDIVTPIGKGQRGLIVTPPRVGTTSVLQSIATAITRNHPECHLMVVLVGARPEEVTDFRSAVKGEVIAATFDLPATDHLLVAELAVERAKRLVELGHDVVVLLDSLTALGRAYNLAAPANGRVLMAGVDASALHPPKQLFGAARKLEDAGSLTMLATALVETGSAVDELFFEEFAGTANLELRLSSSRAAQGLVPTVDPAASGTRHEDRLLAPAEAAVVGDLRKKLSEASTQQALERAIAR